MSNIALALPIKAKTIPFYPTGNLNPICKSKQKQTLVKSNGVAAASEAEPITKIEDVHTVIDYFTQRKNWRDLLFFLVGISSALRASDIAKLRVSDFFRSDGEFKKELVLIEQKTGKKRTVATKITDQMKDILLKWMNAANQEFSYNDFVFQSQRIGNNHIDPNSYYDILKSACNKLELPYHIGTHSMRKTFGYWFLETHKNDVTALAALQKILNHSSEKTTLAYCGITKIAVNEMASDVSSLWAK